jgi:hypothetical protein
VSARIDVKARLENGVDACMPTEARWIRLRYPGRCRSCGRELATGDRALHDRVARSVNCDRCVSPESEVPTTQPIETGTPGASARREYDRRRLARERRRRERWDAIGLGSIGAALTRLSTPHHERAWAIGAQGEERVAARLEKLLQGKGVALLHDRRVPASRANIDHVAIGEGGVTVIDAKHYKGKVRTETRGGLLRPRTEHLWIGGREQTRLVEGVRRQVDLVTAALERAGESVDVCGAMCIVDVDSLPLFSHIQVDGVPIDGPKHIARLARRPGLLSPEGVLRVAATIAQAFPPA